MRPWIEWSAGIGLAATCLMLTGCGGGESNEPAANQSTAADSAADNGEPPAPAPPPGGRAAPAVAHNKGPAAAASKGDAEDTKDAAQASSENPAGAKSEGGSATAEMLALATGGQTGSGGSQPPAGGAGPQVQNPQPGGASPTPAQPANQAGYQAMMMQGRVGGGGPPAGYPGAIGGGSPAGYAQRGGGSPPGNPGGGGQPGGQAGYGAMMQARAAGGQGGFPASPGGPGRGAMGGYPGGPGGAGAQGAAALGQDNGPTDTRTPQGAVRAFLNALQAKDKDRLAEATALRAQTEASTDKIKDLFGKIVDLSISDAEIDDLAKKLQGYRISGENAPKTTGTLGIYVDKRTDEGSVLRLTLKVRKEKKGWGVMDMSSRATEFKPMGSMNRRKSSSKGGGN